MSTSSIVPASAEDWSHLSKVWSSTSPGGIFSMTTFVDGGFEFSHVSEKFLEILGITREQLTVNPRLAFEAVHPMDRKPTADASQQALSNKSEFQEEFRIQRPDGQSVHVMLSCKPSQGDTHGNVHWFGILIDITRQIAATEAIAHKEALERYTTNIAVHMPGGLYTLITYPDGTSKLAYTSPKFLQILHLTPEEVRKPGFNILDLVRPGDLERMRYATLRAIDQMMEWCEDFNLILPNHVEIVAEIRAHPVSNGDGSYTWYGILTDVTHRNIEQKVLREEIARSHQLSHFFSMSDQGFFIADSDGTHPTQVRYASPRLQEIFGVAKQQLEYPGISIQQFIHPEDREGVSTSFKQALQSMQRWHMDFRIQLADQRVVNVEGYSQPIREDHTVRWYGVLMDVTEQRAAERDLKEKLHLTRQMNSLVELAPSGFYTVMTDTTGVTQLQYASQKFADILGLPYKNVMRPDFRLDDHIHPEDREKVVRANIRAFKTLTDFHCEFRIIRPTGEIRYLDASSRPNKEENGNIFWYGVVLDVTDRKLTEEARRKTEEQLRESEFNYRLLAENIEVPHAIVNGDGEWLFINDQMAMVFGHTRVTIPRDVWQKSLPPAEWEKRKTALLYMLETGHRMTDEVPFMVQGEERWYRRIFQPIMTGGVRTQVLITGYDITEERKERERQRQYAAELELKVKERTQELVSALSKEHELAELKSKFVATTSHEFRTPLATINMSAGFLRRYKSRLTDDMLDGKLEVIERQVLHMSRLLDDILMLGRSDAGILSVQRVHLPLSELVEEIVSTMREAWKGKLVNVKVSSKRDSTYTDEKLLRSIITNLLSNALKFSPIGKAVDLTVTCDEKWLGIMVVDEGLGIPLSEQAHLFQPFQRASNVSTIQGTGLGLSIVKRSVELLGGTVAFESQENVGTTFQVQLPAGYPG